MKSILPAFYLVIAITAFSLRGLGQGVTTPSFGPSAVTESFENIPTDWNNYPTGAANGGRTVPVTPFTFRSGITLTEPDPNAPFVVEIEDANKGFVSMYTCPTQVSQADIPDGMAYLDDWNSSPMTFTFPVLAEKVGMYVEGSTCTSSNTITLTAYNAANEVIGTFTTEATGSASNWKNHFIGFNSTTDGIAKITLIGPPIVIDKLTFEKQQECLTTPTFGPSAITESFENIPTSDTNPLQGGGYSKPVTPFNFPSGVTLTEPNPNTGQVLIGDWSKGSAPLYRCNSTVLAAAADVPDGTAFLSMQNTTSTLTFTLPAPSSKVGLYVEGIAGTCVSSTTITLTAYNASDVVIGSCTTEATDDGSNWKNHFLGFRSLGDGITKITLNGPYIDIDKLTFEPIPCVPITLYRDSDHDGFGDPNNSKTVCPNDPSAVAGYVTDNTDCDDTKWLYADVDGDSYAGTKAACGVPDNTDCNDADRSVHTQIIYFADVDKDGYGDHNNPVPACSSTPPPGSVNNGDDCNDGNIAINPATVWYLDADGDGYYTGAGITSCVEPPIPGYKYTGLLGGNDCNDGDMAVHPGAVEICGDGIDNNCDGNIDENCAVTYTLSIANASLNEGNKGKSNMTFTVTLNRAFNTKVTVQYTTQNGTATAGSDYTAKSGTLTFKPGSTKQNVAIPIIGDKTVEPNETFTVVLRNPVNAALLNSIGTGTIVNDDGTTLTSTQAVDMKAVTGDISGKLTVTVSPNPSYSYFTLHTQSVSDKPLQVKTFDALGRQIENRGNIPVNGTLMLGGNYRPGIYFTQVLQGNERITLKLIKQSN